MNNFKAYCQKCKKWYFGWAEKKVCPVCKSKLLSEEDTFFLVKNHREAIRSES